MSLAQIGFDRYQRFRAAADLIRGLALPPGQEVLDVGSHDAAFAAFLPDHRVIACEQIIRPPDQGLQWAEGAVPVVCALDVLEHVAPAERGFFLAELARVASRAVVLGFPAPQAAAAEDLVLRLTGSPWLAQHREHGLPDPAMVEAQLDRLGLAWQRTPNACLPSWTAMMLLMYGVQNQAVRGEISGFFNQNYYALENREPAYRYLYLCRKPGVARHG
ncbi:MAG: hypothetical protein LDL11_07675 [Desulfarculus sp.]|nr:hypothetical protein [Desulfarculus sp.]